MDLPAPLANWICSSITVVPTKAEIVGRVLRGSHAIGSRGRCNLNGAEVGFFDSVGDTSGVLDCDLFAVRGAWARRRIACVVWPNGSAGGDWRS